MIDTSNTTVPVELYEERLAKLLTALRSGEYQQVTYKLRGSNNDYCCLGLACEISGLADWESQDDKEIPYLYLGEATSLPARW